YDVLVPGYMDDVVNSLRLWSAKSSQEFDYRAFIAGGYSAAVEDKTSSENISKVLYPPDDQYTGRELRLKQQYFFASATIQDIIRRFKKHPGRHWEDLPGKVAIQLNDTHAAIAIAEMMRILVDHEQVDWDVAWSMCERTFAFTTHVVFAAALESWPRELFGRMLPRHLQIIDEIDRRLRLTVANLYPGDDAQMERMAIADDSTVHVGRLAVVGSHAINGLSRQHTEILQTSLFTDYARLFPRRFTNKTVGVTPRRWLLGA